jgi:sugar fermentation stimulation protein A
MPDAGCYIAVFRLAAPTAVIVGRLGAFELPAGIHLYTGSAQKNLTARLARHSRRDKPLRWHVDYLSTRAEMLGTIIVEHAPKHRECELAEELADLGERTIARFGASDCGCAGHLIHLPDW